MFNISLKQIGGIWYGAALDGKVINACDFSVRGRKNLLSNIMKSLPYGSEFIELAPEGYVVEVLNTLCQIYVGEPVNLEFPLDMERLSPFTQRVLYLTTKIPRGFVTTYGRIARAVKNERAARAVGAIMASNPFAPIVPCHRVVDSNLKLHGYGHGLEIKRLFLEREGVVFNGNQVAKKCLWIFE